MSKDIIVLTPNGRRQKVHCTPDTSILQVLEDVCEKQGYQPTDYDLKHHNTILDLTNTVRFSNLPNKATLEMIETDRKRNETNVTIGLMLEDGERRTAEFSPKTTLYELIMSLAASEFSNIPNPTILYMRQEVAGVNALKTKTLRQLGLFGGRAILRLLSKAEEATQANVSTVYRKQPTANQENKSDGNNKLDITNYDTAVAGPSDLGKTPKSVINPIEVIMKEKTLKTHVTLQDKKECDRINENFHAEKLTYEETVKTKDVAMDVDQTKSDMSTTVSTISVQDNLERRLKIEEEVTFLGTRKAIVFRQPDSPGNEVDDLPDDFYELTIEEVRKLYTELQQQRIQLENTPLITSSQRKDLEESSEQKLNTYKNAVVRIQFPDQIILQGVFSPADTIGDVINFVKEHLQNPNRPFHIFTTPLKESLDTKISLSEARYVPCVHMHFKWLQDDIGPPYLKEDTYSRQTSNDAAGILASKYRAPSRRRLDDASSSAGTSSKSKNSKVPKWFKS